MLLPRLNAVNIKHGFADGSIRVTSGNSSIHPNISASLKLLGNNPSDCQSLLTNTSEWLSYNQTSGAIIVDVQPPKNDVSCNSAVLEVVIPMPLNDVIIFSQSTPPTKQNLFIYCLSGPGFNDISGCIDLDVYADYVSISIEPVSGFNPAKINLSTYLALVEEIPFRTINMFSNNGHLKIKNLLATGNVALKTSLGNATMKNVAAKNVQIQSKQGVVTVSEIAAFKNLQAILINKGHNQTKLKSDDFGLITMESEHGNCNTTMLVKSSRTSCNVTCTPRCTQSCNSKSCTCLGGVLGGSNNVTCIPICCEAKQAFPKYKALCNGASNKTMCSDPTSGFGESCQWTCGSCNANTNKSQYQTFCFEHNNISSCNSVNRTCHWTPSYII